MDWDKGREMAGKEYKIAICDDEAKQIQYLSSLVKQWAKVRKHTIVIHVFESAEAFLFHYAEDKAYDMLILDIEMGEMNGIELARRIRSGSETIQILFVTAYADFIAEGYEVAALHYLMKPVDENKLSETLDRAVSNLGKAKRFEIFYQDGEAIRIAVDEIVCVEAFAHCVAVTTTRERYRINETISEMEKILGNGFIRCHRSYLIAMKYMKKITKTDVVMDTDISVPLSRRRYDAVNREFIRYYKE